MESRFKVAQTATLTLLASLAMALMLGGGMAQDAFADTGGEFRGHASLEACIEARSGLYGGIDGPYALGLLADCNRMWSNSDGLIPLSGVLTEQAQCVASHDGAASAGWTAFCEDARWIAAGVFADPNAEPPTETPAEAPAGEPAAYLGEACVKPLHPFTKSRFETGHTHYVSAAGPEGSLVCDREGELGPFGVLEHESYTYPFGEHVHHTCPHGDPLTDDDAFAKCYEAQVSGLIEKDMLYSRTTTPVVGSRVYEHPPEEHHDSDHGHDHSHSAGARSAGARGASEDHDDCEGCSLRTMWEATAHFPLVLVNRVTWKRYELKAEYPDPIAEPEGYASQTVSQTLDVDGTRVEFRADRGLVIGTPPVSDDEPVASPEASLEGCIEAKSALYGGIDGPHALGLLADCNRMWSSRDGLVPLSGTHTEQAQCVASQRDGVASASANWTAFCEDDRWIAAGIFADPNAEPLPEPPAVERPVYVGDACVRPLHPFTRSQFGTDHTHYVSAAGREGFIACDREGELGPFGVVEHESHSYTAGETITHYCPPPAGEPLTDLVAFFSCYDRHGTTSWTGEYPLGTHAVQDRVYRIPPGAPGTACGADPCTLMSMWAVGVVSGTSVQWDRYELKAVWRIVSPPIASPIHASETISQTLDIDGTHVEFLADRGLVIGTPPVSDDEAEAASPEASLKVCIESKAALYGGIDGPHVLGLLADCNRMWSSSAGLVPLSGALTEQAQCAASHGGAASGDWAAFCEDARWIAAGIFADPNAEPPAEEPAVERPVYVGDACVRPLHPFTKSQFGAAHTHYVSAAGREGFIACDREGELGPFGVVEHETYSYPFGATLVHSCPAGDPLTDTLAWLTCYEIGTTGTTLLNVDYPAGTYAAGDRVYRTPPDADCGDCTIRSLWTVGSVSGTTVSWSRYELKATYPDPTTEPVGYASQTVSQTLDIDGTHVEFVHGGHGLVIGTFPAGGGEPGVEAAAH